MKKDRLKFREKVGIIPLGIRLKQAKVALLGEEDVPASKFDLSSLSQLHPGISPKMWRGKAHIDKKVIISNLYNHTQTPIEEGWSVQKSQVLDFRGKQLTYNSHNGTDFAIPVGTTVCAAAPGEVVEVRSEFNRGGLKVFIDHGKGLITCYAHLARSLVKVGEILKRGQAIALSGYSGLDGFSTFPFGIPHVHFNVWLNCAPIDPFPHQNQPSIWRGDDLPTANILEEEEVFTPADFHEENVFQAIEHCKTKSARDRIKSYSTLKEKAFQTIIEMNYYPTRFTEIFNLYAEIFPRTPQLDLPFHANDFDGVVFLDDVKSAKKRK
jgi:murein DD-endopeptidase MepM/ murein hydrolase activator NlpD